MVTLSPKRLTSEVDSILEWNRVCFVNSPYQFSQFQDARPRLQIPRVDDDGRGGGGGSRPGYRHRVRHSGNFLGPATNHYKIQSCHAFL